MGFARGAFRLKGGIWDDWPEILSRECTLRLTSPNPRDVAGVFFEGGGDGFIAGEALGLGALDAG